MRNIQILAAAACLTLAASVTSAQEGIDAITRARYDLKLGFTVGGNVLEVPIKAGDVVKTGDVLIRLEDKEGEAQIEIWRFRAESDVAIRAAEARLELATAEQTRLRDLVTRQAAAPFELQRSEIQTRVEALNAEQARMDQQEAQRQLGIYRARNERYTLKAPTDGIIEQILVNPGETVEDTKPVLRLVVTDPLWIDVATPTAATLALKVGDPAWVISRLSSALKPAAGRIIHIASVADSASDTRLVRVEVPNEVGIPAGGQVTVWFTNPDGLASVTGGTRE